MNKISKQIIPILLILALVLIPTAVQAAGFVQAPADRIITGGEYTLESGKTLRGSLIAFGGNVVLEKDSLVTKDVIVFGGTLVADGKVDGSFVSFGGDVTLNENTVVRGDLVEWGGNLEQNANAVINGEVISSSGWTQTDTDWDIRPTPPFIPMLMWTGPGVFLSVLWFLFVSLMMAALGVVITLLFPIPVERVGDAAVKQPIVSWGIGLLTAIVLPFLLVFLGLTIILLPVTLVGILGMVAAFFFGIVAIGYEIGAKFAQQTNNRWVPAVACGVGTFALTFVTFGLAKLIPCIGWLLGSLVVFPMGLGAVILTRFGTQPYPCDLVDGNTCLPVNNAEKTNPAPTPRPLSESAQDIEPTASEENTPPAV